MTPQDLQEHHDAMKARFAQPSTERVVSGDRVFIRNLGKRCPWCRDVFFAYQVEGHEHQPYQVDQEPPEGQGQRETCGHPLCHEAEEKRQFERCRDLRMERARARERAQAGPPPAPAGGRKV